MELSLPAAVVLGPSVAGFKRNLAKLTFSTFFTLLLIIMCLHVLIIALASLHDMYFTAM